MHSQGSIVSAHLLDRLIRDGHIVTSRNQDWTQKEDQQDLVMLVELVGAELFPSSIGLGVQESERIRKRKVQKVGCLALCGIHLTRWGI